MIKNERTPVPEALRKKKKLISNELKRLKNGKNITSKNMKNYWRFAKDGLGEMHHDKCCYCERKRDKARELDVEHYRPKGKVAEASGHPGYWWLAYEWDNLLLACKTCNQGAKKTHFPLKKELSRAKKKSDDLQAEDPLLLNPSIDDVEKYFLYEWDEPNPSCVRISSKDKNKKGKGQRTIDILDLNRDRLLEERKDYLTTRLNLVRRLLESIPKNRATVKEKDVEKNVIEILKSMISPEEQFSGFAKFYFESCGLNKYF